LTLDAPAASREAPAVQENASALVSASAQLLEGLTRGEQPLGTVSASLADLATALGVRQMIVAIDDATYGRQVFCSGRSPLGDRGELLSGPPRACTEPPSPLDDALGRLIVAAVGTAFERARARDPREPRLDDLVTVLGAATERSSRYGWGFILVLLRLDHADDRARRQIKTQLRATDTVVELGSRDYGILLAAAAGDEVPRILARVGRGGALSTFCYGLAACPGDAVEAGTLLVLATTRLGDADDLRADNLGAGTAATTTPEVHALYPPKV
jgi:hypothetical protein